MCDLIVVSMVKTIMTGAPQSSSSSEEDKDSTQTISSTPLLIVDYANINISLQNTIHKLNSKNYLEWAQCVKLVIDEKWKLGHLIGEVKQLATNDPNLKSWRSENSLVNACLAPKFHGTYHTYFC